MRRLLSLLLVWLLCCGMTAAQYEVLLDGNKTPVYYISNSGSDSNSGLSPGAPWQTVAKVNAVTKCVPGVQFLFQRGGEWHEELVVPCSGTASKLISFGAYGTGTNPIITGADVVGGGGWTNLPVSPLDTQTFSTGALSGTFWANNSCTFPTSPVQGSSTHSLQCVGSQSISQVPISTNVYEIDAYFQISANTATNGQISRVIFMEGSAWNGANGVGVWVNLSGTQLQLSVGRGGAAGATKFNITQGTWYLLRFLVSSNSGNSTDFGQLYANGTLVSSLSGLSLTSALNSQVHVGPAGAFNTVFTQNFDSLSTYNQNSTNPSSVWSTTVAWQPYAVIFNESQNYSTLAPQTSAAAVSTTNQWFWSSNTLYVYSSGGNPSSVYTSPGIQAAHRTYAVVRNNQNYWSINNTIIEGADQTNGTPGCASLCVSYGGPGDSTTPVDVSASGLEVRYNGWEGAWFGATGGSYANSTFHDNLGMGVDFDTASNMTGVNLSSDNNLYGSYPGSVASIIHNLTLIDFEANGNAQNGLSLSLGAGYFITGCNLHNNTFNGIYLDGSSVTGAVISGCTINGNGASGLFDTGGASVSGLVVQSSLVYGNTQQGVFIEGGGSNVVKLYNNVIEGNGICYEGTGANTAITAENNICYNNTVEGQIDTSLSGALALNYNDYYHAAGGNFMTYHGVAMTFALWQTTASQDANSITTNPNFTSVPSNFTLQAGSPAIAAGTPLTPNINTFLGAPFANPPSMGAYGP